MGKIEKMSISLGSTYSDPMDIGINMVSKTWVGFIKLYLRQLDGTGLPYSTVNAHPC